MSRRTHLPELGPQGEGWVVAQVGAYVLVALAGLRGRRWPRRARPLLTALAIPFGVVGGTMITAGVVSLGRSLTPNPRPTQGGSLRDDGLYGIVRHPIYAGVILSALAWSLWRGPAAVCPTVLTVVVVDLKSRREEAWLVERYPGYASYRDRVRGRFLPRVW